MFCGEGRYSVSMEVNNQGKWLAINFISQTMAYYFMVHNRDEGVVWASLLFVSVTSAIVFWTFHRMKVARVKHGIEEGEEEWTSAVTMYVIALSFFYIFQHVVDDSIDDSEKRFAVLNAQNSLEEDSIKSLRDVYSKSQEESDFIYRNIPKYSHLLFIVSAIFEFMTYVYTSRFGAKADDTYGDTNL